MRWLADRSGRFDTTILADLFEFVVPAQAVSPSTGARSPTRTSSSRTPARASCPWYVRCTRKSWHRVNGASPFRTPPFFLSLSRQVLVSQSARDQSEEYVCVDPQRGPPKGHLRGRGVSGCFPVGNDAYLDLIIMHGRSAFRPNEGTLATSTCVYIHSTVLACVAEKIVSLAVVGSELLHFEGILKEEVPNLHQVARCGPHTCRRRKMLLVDSRYSR